MDTSPQPAPSQLTPLEVETRDMVKDHIGICGICLDTYEAPKVLMCSHTFCSQCLQKLVDQTERSEQQCLICPNCRQPTHVPQNGVLDLQEDSRVQRLCDFEGELMTLTSHTVQDTLRNLDMRRQDIISNQTALETQITRLAEKLTATVNARKEALIDELATTTHKKLQTLSAQEHQVRVVQIRLPGFWDMVNTCLQRGPEGVEEAIHNVQSVAVQCSSFPKVQADTRLFYNYVAMETCQKFGDLYADPVCSENCTVQGVPKFTLLQKETTATLQTLDRDGQKNECSFQLISCELVSMDGTSTVSGTVKRTGMGQYELCYRAPKRGRYQLQVRVEGQHVQGSPFSVIAVKDLTTPTKPIAGLDMPWGVAVDKRGHTIVAEWGGGNITIFSGNGDKMTSFSSCGSGQLLHPRGVAVLEDDNIVVADWINHQILKFSPKGQLLETRGKRGTNALEFHWPIGIGVHPLNNQVYITEQGNNRVQVLDANLNYVTMFGSHGSDNGQFVNPRDITFDCDGSCYVVDQKRVQVFTEDGQYLRQFGHETECSTICSIASDSDIVYIADGYNNRILLFTIDGCFLTSFGALGSGPGHFIRPQGICVDDNGLVYVSDWCTRCTDRIQVF